MVLRIYIYIYLFIIFPACVAIASNSSNESAGREIFISICSSCHGINGKASINHAPSFYYGERLDKDILILVRSVREGLGRMPPQEENLKDSQIQDAISYAKTLQKYFEKNDGYEERKYEDEDENRILDDQGELTSTSGRQYDEVFNEENSNGQGIFFNFDGSIWTVDPEVNN